MALIKCPECDKEISDRAVACIYCGYPLNIQHITENINGEQYDVSFLYDYNMSQIEKIKKLCKLTGCDLMTSKEIVLKYHHAKQTSTVIAESNIPKCPTCGSTNISKVSSMAKVGSVAMFGFLSQKVKKTWCCNNCKYEW